MKHSQMLAIYLAMRENGYTLPMLSDALNIKSVGVLKRKLRHGDWTAAEAYKLSLLLKLNFSSVFFPRVECLVKTHATKECP